MNRATVITPTGDRVPDASGTLLDYYLDQSAQVDGYQFLDTSTDVSFPQQWENGQRVPTPGQDVPPTPFDPGEHTVSEVEDYLDTADDVEVQRVLDAETAGKDRASLRKHEDDRHDAES